MVAGHEGVRVELAQAESRRRTRGKLFESGLALLAVVLDDDEGIHSGFWYFPIITNTQ